MATAMHPHSHLTTHRTVPQKVCIGTGIFFVALGLIGIAMPDFLSLHLSLAHNMIHLISGSLALWCGYADESKKAYNYCLGFGVLYGLLGVLGFIVGQPGYPGVGYMEADENLMRVIPNVLEFATADHMEHLLISAALLLTGYYWNKQRTTFSRTTIETQSGRER